jgi:hypothetical protein
MGVDAREPDLDAFSALAEANYCAYVVTLPGTEVADSPQCLRVRTAIPFAYLNSVVCRALPTGAALDALIAETRGYYAAHSSPHSWYVTPFTTPADVGKALAVCGLVRQGQANMAIELAALPESAPVPAECTIEEVYGAERFDEWGRTYVTGYRMPPALAPGALATLRGMPSGPGTPLRRYLARLGGLPVASATLFNGGRGSTTWRRCPRRGGGGSRRR